MTDEKLTWIDAAGLAVEGKGWTDTECFWDRLPARAKGKVRPEVWNLSRHSAGLAVRFQTDAARIHARWRLKEAQYPLDHMPASGCSGLDLYVREGRRWQWAGMGRCTGAPDARATLTEPMAPGTREFLLYLPLFNSVERVEIGVPEGAALTAAAPRKKKPLVIYGTSIVHGACASRAGMSYAAILGRRLDRPVINLGFSGNGQAEPEVAEFLAELDAAAFVVDPLPNLAPATVTERIEPFVRTLRRRHATTPVLLVECIPYPLRRSAPWLSEHWANINAALRGAVERLRAAGDANLHLAEGEGLLGNDGEGTVDGVHPTDLGFLRMARSLLPIVRGML